MSLGPSNTAEVESINTIFAFQSANIETNMPQTGHFSFRAGAWSSSAANAATVKQITIRHVRAFFTRPPARPSSAALIFLLHHLHSLHFSFFSDHFYILGHILIGHFCRLFKGSDHPLVRLQKVLGVVLFFKGPLSSFGHDAGLLASDHPEGVLRINELFSVELAHFDRFRRFVDIVRHIDGSAVKTANGSHGSIIIFDHHAGKVEHAPVHTATPACFMSSDVVLHLLGNRQPADNETNGNHKVYNVLFFHLTPPFSKSICLTVFV